MNAALERIVSKSVIGNATNDGEEERLFAALALQKTFEEIVKDSPQSITEEAAFDAAAGHVAIEVGAGIHEDWFTEMHVIEVYKRVAEHRATERAPSQHIIQSQNTPQARTFG